MSGPQFTWRIDFGQIVQAMVVAGSVFLWIMTERASIQSQFADATTARAVLAQRVSALEGADAKEQARDEAFAAEMRQSLDRISGQVADLRTLVAAKK